MTIPCLCKCSRADTRSIFQVWEHRPLHLRGSSDVSDQFGFGTIALQDLEFHSSTCRGGYHLRTLPTLCGSFPMLLGQEGVLQAAVVWKHWQVLCWVVSTKVVLPCFLGLIPSYLGLVVGSAKKRSWILQILSSKKTSSFAGKLAPWLWLVCCRWSALATPGTLLHD